MKYKIEDYSKTLVGKTVTFIKGTMKVSYAKCSIHKVYKKKVTFEGANERGFRKLFDLSSLCVWHLFLNGWFDNAKAWDRITAK